jgi:Transposase domain (DUF772).
MQQIRGENRMYKRQCGQISVFEDETHFGGVKLDSGNQWVKLGKRIPWASLEERYAGTFASNVGNPGMSCRMAVGSLVIQKRYGFSDEDTRQEIQMNPYLQYFIGLSGFQHEAPFDQSTMTLFRKRVTPEMLTELNDFIIGRRNPYEKKPEDEDDDSPENPACGESAPKEDAAEKSNHGTLTLDATCAPQDIHFPTDISLLNDAREWLEDTIGAVYPKGEKPRTYRRKARKDYLFYARNRRPSLKLLRRSIRKQLGYVRRNLGYLEAKQAALSEKQQHRLRTIESLYRQQREMHEKRINSIPNRIVSLHEPWVRPIVRGKAKAPVEFGAKIAIGLVDGYSRVERLDWNAFSEGNTLIASAEAYRKDYGFYPDRILADKAYRTRENLQFCKERGIRMAGPKLGRPPKDKALYRQQLHEEWLESGERAAVECVFGLGKRRYDLDCIMTRLQHSSEVSIHLTFLTMNLFRKLRLSFFAFFYCLLCPPFYPFAFCPS